MKKLLIIALLGASGVFAQQVLSGSVFTSYVENGTTAGTPIAAPGLATQGIPLLAPVKGNAIAQDLLVKYVNVTVQPVWDGGQGAQITAVAARAWKFMPQRVCAFDGGTTCITNFDAGVPFAWSRWPSMDVSYSTDSGTPYVQNGVGGVTFSQGLGAPYGNAFTAPTFQGRLYYTIETLSVADAGTMQNARVLLEGVY